MPIVERVSGPSVGVEPIPVVTPRARLDSNFADGMIRGVGVLGDALVGIAQREADKADTAQVLEAQRKLGDWERTWFDPNNPTGVTNRRGRDALGLVDEIAPDFDKVSTELETGIRSEAAREAFRKHLAVRRESLLDRVNGHAVREHDLYVANEFKASVLNNTELAATAAVEGRERDQLLYMQEGLRTIAAQAQLTGQPPELTKQQEDAFLSSVHATAVNGKMARGDATGAMIYLQDNAEDIGIEQRVELIARLRPQLIDAAVYKFLDGMDAGVDPVADLGAGVGVQELWGALEWKESRGNQAAVSPKGAVGVAQVMPATGPEAAAFAGLPWDPKRFKEDADYNRALGQAYLGAQLTTYGTPALALAAYNAGPGRVEKWIKQYGDPRLGQVSVAEWVSRIPIAETKDYVTTILARTGGGVSTQPQVVTASSGGAAVPAPVAAPAPQPAGSLEAELARVRGMTPEFRSRAEAGIRQKWNDRKVAERDAEQETQKAIFLTINTSGDYTTPLKDLLPPEQFTYAAQHNMLDALDAQRAAKRAGVPVVTPADLRLSLQDVMHKAALGDPIAAAEVAKLNPYDARLSLGDPEREAIARLQLALRKADKPALAAAATDGEITATITRAGLAGLGATRESLKANKELANRFNQFDRNMRTWVSQYSAAHGGKKPSFVELQAAADHMVMTAPAVIDGDEEPRFISSIRHADQVPPRAVLKITERLTRAGLPANDANIARYYRDAARRGLHEDLLQ